MSTVIDLLTRARQAGLRLACGPGETLRVRGPRAAEPLAHELLARKEAILAAVNVYNDLVERLDWSKGKILDQPQPCVLCGKSTLLIEPYDGRPCHKSCAEAAIRCASWPEGPAA